MKKIDPNTAYTNIPNKHGILKPILIKSLSEKQLEVQMIICTKEINNLNKDLETFKRRNFFLNRNLTLDAKAEQKSNETKMIYLENKLNVLIQIEDIVYYNYKQKYQKQTFEYFENQTLTLELA